MACSVAQSTAESDELKLTGDEPVVIVGGGLAGLAAAAALAVRGVKVRLLESRPRWGGRASSITDQTTGEQIDNCQHVSLGCCTNFAAFCKLIGIEDHFRRERKLYFVGPDGRIDQFAASGLPAPLHLSLAFLKLRYLNWSEKRRLAFGLKALAHRRFANDTQTRFSDWLKQHKQPESVCTRFWHVVLVSALSETLDRVHVAAARKVFVDAFMATHDGWEVSIPTGSLDELYGQRLVDWLQKHAVDARLQCGVAELMADANDGVRGVVLRERAAAVDSAAAVTTTQRDVTADTASSATANDRPASRSVISARQVIVAVPPHLVTGLMPAEIAARNDFAGLKNLESAPISSVHLWFDREIMSLPHATLIDRFGQWVFRRLEADDHAGGDHAGGVRAGAGQQTASTQQSASGARAGCYYQVVISASRSALQRPQTEVVEQVVSELRDVFPAARAAVLLHGRVITEHRAAMSMLPGVEALRMSQKTAIPGLYLAGCWTRTGWPSTMEGAVRSGFLAAAAVLKDRGLDARVMAPDAQPGWLAKWLLNL